MLTIETRGWEVGKWSRGGGGVMMYRLLAYNFAGVGLLHTSLL